MEIFQQKKTYLVYAEPISNTTGPVSYVGILNEKFEFCFPRRKIIDKQTFRRSFLLFDLGVVYVRLT